MFSTSNAFLKSAMALEEEHRKKIGHAGPILFCYCHAIELYLKALLRLVHSVAALSTKFGHDFERLLTEAEGSASFLLMKIAMSCRGSTSKPCLRRDTSERDRSLCSLKTSDAPTSAWARVSALSCARQACR